MSLPHNTHFDSTLPMTRESFDLLWHMLASGKTETPRSKKIKVFRNYFCEDTNYVRGFVKDAHLAKLICTGNPFNNGESMIFHVTKQGYELFKSCATALGYKVIEDNGVQFLHPNTIEVK